MPRTSWFGGAAAALVLACPLTAVAQQPAAPPSQAQPAQPGTFTEAQLRSFAAASVEVDPLSRSLASATAEQRTQIAGQIRTALQRRNLDADTYNAIAARAQTDTQLAARIAALRPAQSGGPGASQN
jgi:hypothetical protein